MGLALRAQGREVEMVDSNLGNSRLANDLVASSLSAPANLVVLALPTSNLNKIIARENKLNPNSVFMDVGSVKVKPQVEIDAISGLSPRFCGSHPMAGRESGGPEAARADLFDGRPWILTPSRSTSAQTLQVVRGLVESFGAIAIEMQAEEHDRAVALLSHLPQISSSLLAGQITRANLDWLPLSGQGLRDSTRIARSDPKLWREILSLNRSQIRPLLEAMQSDLADLISNFDDDSAIEEFIAKGKGGTDAIPGKHGGKAREYSYLPIVIEDKAGQLASLFQECAHAGVNVEDLSIEHSPGQFTGLITLSLSRLDSEKLSEHLIVNGWKVQAIR